jgi:putative phosphonate transport system ATP-binding protein
MNGSVLDVRDLTVRYGPGCEACTAGLPTDRDVCPQCRTVLACVDVSFDVWPGEVLGIVGESGSGKSTVLAAANLDVTPTTGQIVLGGTDVTGVRGARRRRLRAEMVGIVHQTPQQGLDLDLTAGGNVASRPLAAGWRSYERTRERVLDLLGAVELDAGRVDTVTRVFSGGMRQRVQLAKALANSPQVLLLDEPTSGLDVSVQARILDLIRRLQGETGVAMVIVSHDLSVIRMLADQVLVMRRGRIVERGLTDQILADPQDPYSQLLVSSQLA